MPPVNLKEQKGDSVREFVNPDPQRFNSLKVTFKTATYLVKVCVHLGTPVISYLFRFLSMLLNDQKETNDFTVPRRKPSATFQGF